MAKKILFSFELEPGMIVAEDIYRSNGSLIFPKHTMLNQMMIDKLPSYNITELPIVDGPIEKPQINIEKLIEMALKENSSKELSGKADSYAQKFRQSEEFKEFNNKYSSALDKINDTFDYYLSGTKDLPADGIADEVSALVPDNPVRLFDMLHNMKASDESVYRHCVNVALISTVLAKWLSFSGEDLKNITTAGLLHDIGKFTLPPEILNKPGKLSPDEFTLIKKHPVNGYAILKDTPIDNRIKEVVLTHHERCDGSGYTVGLSGDRIHPYSKIIAIADVYDAMTSPRSYREALCPLSAIHVFETEGISKYDPKFIMTFMEHIGSAYLNNNVLLSNGEIGEIVMLNKHSLSKPVVKCGEQFIDLSKNTDLTIKSIV